MSVFKVGDRVFSHYISHPSAGISGWGTVERIDDVLPDSTWYTIRTDEGDKEYLNDGNGNWDMARIIPPHIASRYGYGTDPKS